MQLPFINICLSLRPKNYFLIFSVFPFFSFNEAVRRCKYLEKLWRWCHERVNVSKEDLVSRASEFYANFRLQFSSFCFRFHLEHLTCRNFVSLQPFSPYENKFTHYAVYFPHIFIQTFLMTLSQKENSLGNRTFSINFCFYGFHVEFLQCVTAWFKSDRFDSLLQFLQTSKQTQNPQNSRLSAYFYFTFPSHSPDFFTFPSQLFRFNFNVESFFLLIKKILSFTVSILNGKELKEA